MPDGLFRRHIANLSCRGGSKDGACAEQMRIAYRICFFTDDKSIVVDDDVVMKRTGNSNERFQFIFEIFNFLSDSNSDSI